MEKTAQQILKERDHGLTGRTNFDTYWQTVHDLFDNVGMDVNTTYYPGTELTITQLFDTYCQETADILAAGLNTYLTPASSRWFGLRTSDPRKMRKKKVLHYLKDVESEVAHTLNTSNFYDVMPSFYKNSGVYGTSILFEEEDPFDRVRFYTIPIKRVVMTEDARQRPSEFYIEFEYTATQAVTRFGPDKVHPTVLKEHQYGRYPNKKHKYTLYIGPNWHRNPMGMDNKNKEWMVKWIDDAHQITIEEGGFDELPALAHRFYKRDSIVWGFSPAMKALLDGRLLNTKAKTLLRSEMKLTDPPVALPENAFLLPFNGNPRGVNHYNKAGLSQKDVFPVMNYGNVAVGQDSVEYSKSRIRSQMFTDVFLAFEGITKQMNNPEVFERIAEKMTLLGPSVGRFINVSDQVIHRTIAILGRQGKLPEPPQEIIDDPDYEIDYLSTLAKAQRNPELKSMNNALQMVGNIAQFNPDVIDKINADKAVDSVFEITGAPVQILRDDEEVQAIRDDRREAAAEQQRIELMSAGADIALKGTQAGKNVRETQAIGI